MITIETEITKDNISIFKDAINLCWDSLVELYHYDKLIYTPNLNLGELESNLNDYDLEIKVGEDKLYVDLISNGGVSLTQYHKKIMDEIQ